MHWTHFEDPASLFALAPLPNGSCLAATEQGLWQFHPQPSTGTFRLKGRGDGSGGAWKQTAPQFAQVPLTSVAAHGNTWLIGSNGDIAVSRDAGKTWAIATLPVKAHVLALAASPAFDKDHIALAATAKDGVLRSADGGATWHAWNYGLLDLGVNALALSPTFADDATCFAATDHAVFMSTNSGRAWTELPIGMDNGPFTSLAVVTTRRGASLQVGTEGNGVWSSAEPFEDWQRAKGLRADEINFLLPGLAATTSGVYSADGAKWRKASDEGDVVCMAALDDGALILGTAGNGVWHGSGK
jgi:photosystem II stability/assembly factor-like uncharacterized protein